MNAKSELVKKWIQKAENDLGSAQACADKGFYDTATFHCQQAAEKALKAYLTEHDLEFDKIHDIEKLAIQAQQADETWSRYMQEAKILTPYAVLSRYPDEEDPTLQDFEMLIQHAAKILSFAKKSLNMQ